MMLVKVQTISNVSRELRKQYQQASSESWKDVGAEFHSQMRDKRFTHAHATKAGYEPRVGSNMQPGQKGFWRSYTGRKLRKFGHTRPLEFTGETRRAVSLASISSSRAGVKVAYPGARKFNFSTKHTNVRMADEFRRVLPEEADALAAVYAARLAERFTRSSE
jgi:hypothetical protein